MRPRSFERGKVVVVRLLHAVMDASMRPRSFERGKNISQICLSLSPVSFNEAAFF